MKLSNYHIAVPLGDMDDRGLILYSFLTGNMHVIDKSVYEQMVEGCFEDVDISILDTLIDSRIAVTSSEDLSAKDYQEDILQLIILPTNRCNLRCVYCGETKGAGRITAKVKEDIVRLVDEQIALHGYRAVEVGWFGGEPTLDIDSICQLSHRIKEVAKKWGVSYRGKIVTNGIRLSRDVSRKLIEECDISFFEITIDGYGSYNDARRKDATDRGFYEKIVDNVENLCTFNNIVVSIRCNVDNTNAGGVMPMLDDFKRRRIHQKIQFYVATIHSWGTESGNMAISQQDFGELQMQVFKYKIENGFNSSTIELLPYRNTVKQCIATGTASYVIDHCGYVYQCDEQPYTGDREAIIGHVSTRAKIVHKNELFDIPEQLRSKCMSCPIYPVCGGGCPKRAREHGKLECAALLYNMYERVRFVYDNFVKECQQAIPVL